MTLAFLLLVSGLIAHYSLNDLNGEVQLFFIFCFIIITLFLWGGGGMYQTAEFLFIIDSMPNSKQWI